MSNGYLFFDTETSGFPPKGAYGMKNTSWAVQYGMITTDEHFNVENEVALMVKRPEWGGKIHPGAYGVHGISEERANEFGVREQLAAHIFHELSVNRRIACHNVAFDRKFAEGMIRFHFGVDMKEQFDGAMCTMLSTVDFCKLPKKRGQGWEWPKLEELHTILFEETFDGAHDALADVRAMVRCAKELRERGIL